MKAILVEDGQLVMGDAPEPEVGVGQVKIAVAASAVNRADLVQAAGAYPPPPGASPILGLECAGEVVEVGEGVQRVKPGDQVCALLAGGGYAETVAVPAGQVLRVPQGLSLREAAAVPEVFATAYLNLYQEAGLVTNERVLLHAGASGVGTAAIQLCRESHNPTFVTVGGDAKLKRCLELGASGGADRHQGGFADQVAEWTDGEGFDVILDPVGANYLVDNLASLRMDGRLVLIGLMGGIKAELPLAMVLMKRLRLIGSTLRARSIAAKSAVMDGLEIHLWPKLESGAIKPIIETLMPMEDAQKAHDLVASNQTFGKVVLAW
ncbi:MAG: NAD(P)H-quinone oxidoreductase [Gammaproteobacteria bacterium]|nr:NAD(P)H-quinone oxidoreductase [Gammaproteobacteria bacterium]